MSKFDAIYWLLTTWAFYKFIYPVPPCRHKWDEWFNHGGRASSKCELCGDLKFYKGDNQ